MNNHLSPTGYPGLWPERSFRGFRALEQCSDGRSLSDHVNARQPVIELIPSAVVVAEGFLH